MPRHDAADLSLNLTLKDSPTYGTPPVISRIQGAIGGMVIRHASICGGVAEAEVPRRGPAQSPICVQLASLVFSSKIARFSAGVRSEAMTTSCSTADLPAMYRSMPMPGSAARSTLTRA